MSTSEKQRLAHLLEHHPDEESGYCELCEAASIASVLLPHAMALAERSEVSLALMAMELAAQAMEGVSHADDVGLDVVLAAVKRRAKDLQAERESASVATEVSGTGRVHH